MNLKFRIKIAQEDDGLWYVDCLDFQGCHTFGESREEAMRNILDVISDRLYAGVERVKAEPKQWATGSSTETVEITA